MENKNALALACLEIREEIRRSESIDSNLLGDKIRNKEVILKEPVFGSGSHRNHSPL